MYYTLYYMRKFNNILPLSHNFFTKYITNQNQIVFLKKNQAYRSIFRILYFLTEMLVFLACFVKH